MFKKLVCVIICAAMLCSLTGCGFLKFDLSKEREPIDPAVSPSAYSRQVLRDMQGYLKDGNADSLCAMFASDLGIATQEVQNLLGFIDGEIVSIDKSSVEPGGGTVKYGEYLEYAYAGSFIISTDTGKEYNCHFSGFAVYDEHPGEVGLDSLYFLVPHGSDYIYWGIDYWGVGKYFNEKGQRLDRDGKIVDPWY